LTDLRDLTLRQAQLELEKQRLVLGEVSQDPSVVSALVIRASLNGRELKAGTRIAQGSVVDLVTGIVQSDSAGYIPDLAGLALDDAFESLNNAGLNLGKVEYSGAISDTTSALIFKQRPEFIPNQPIQSGAYIDVWLRQSE
jgi:beta-lactam-binding protein with PASTA domain